MIDDTQIDWTRVAKPQPDGYDTDVLGRFLHDRWRWAKVVPGPNDATLVNGSVRVTVDPYRYIDDKIVDTTVTDGALREIDRHLAAWPDGYSSLAAFLDEMCPKWSPRSFTSGCFSGHRGPDEVRCTTTVIVTVNNPHGCAEGIYQEFGWLRLETVGIRRNRHDGRLIVNTREDLHDSPFRGDVLCPIVEIINGLYASMMMSENDLWCVGSGVSTRESASYLKMNIPKIADGITIVEKYTKPTPLGEPFVTTLLLWAKNIVERGHAVIVT